MKTLVVDDLAENRYLLEQVLRAKGQEIRTAADGAEALEALGRDSFQLIISDIMMPRMDGFELCFNVKLDPRLKDIPFVFYTATYTTDEDRAFALSLGADAFVLKPAEPGELVARLEEVLARTDRPVATIAPRLTKDQLAFLREYNERLVRKLEKKVVEARDANDRLQKLNTTLEQRVAEKTAALKQSNAELELFASTVTHDLRMPLRNISGFATLVRENAAGRLAEEEKQWLDRILGSVKRLDRMINDVLEYSRLSLNAVACEPTDVEALVRDLVQASPEFHGRVEIVHPLPAVRAHGPSLRQVLFNLFANAIKFVAPNATPHVRVLGEPHDGQVRLWIEDNGVGIPAERQRAIFQPFERLHHSYEGSGLGLAIVARAVERMHGKVGVESQPGRGSRFWVQLDAA